MVLAASRPAVAGVKSEERMQGNGVGGRSALILLEGGRTEENLEKVRSRSRRKPVASASVSASASGPSHAVSTAE